ncbi:MAG: insulinase family protein [Oscillospiraceae bacterium]|nr:insulinase family protein [Oscillospiraceae bacterium]
MQREQILPGVYLTSLPADKFKRSRISINFIMPGKRSTATSYALLPMVMERGYEACPDMTQLSIKLAQLYGASLGVDSGMQGPNRVLNFSMVGIKDDFAFGGEALSKEYADILFGVAFHPDVKNGAFDSEAIEIEKDKLREVLESEINEKRIYCVRQARRKFFGDDESGIERYGYLDDIDPITPQQLYQAYLNMVQTAAVEVLVMGADAQSVKTLLVQQLQKIDRCLLQPAQPHAMPVTAPQSCVEPLPTEQGKVCMLFTTAEILKNEDLSKMRMAIGVLGGTPTSRLFTNVREKQSLCYYCASSYSHINGMLSIDSGVEHKNAEKLQQAVLAELDKLKTEEITQKEIEDVKRTLYNSLDAVEDNLPSIENWYMGEIMRGSFKTPQQVKQEIAMVSEGDIRAMLDKFTLQVTYTLTNTKGGAAHA